MPSIILVVQTKVFVCNFTNFLHLCKIKDYTYVSLAQKDVVPL